MLLLNYKAGKLSSPLKLKVLAWPSAVRVPCKPIIILTVNKWWTFTIKYSGHLCLCGWDLTSTTEVGDGLFDGPRCLVTGRSTCDTIVSELDGLSIKGIRKVALSDIACPTNRSERASIFLPSFLIELGVDWGREVVFFFSSTRAYDFMLNVRLLLGHGNLMLKKC